MWNEGRALTRFYMLLVQVSPSSSRVGRRDKDDLVTEGGVSESLRGDLHLPSVKYNLLLSQR